MNNLEVLEKFGDFNFTLYTECNSKLTHEYTKMYAALKDSGFTLLFDWDLTGGILVEGDNTVIAGIFFNTVKFEKTILIHLAYVDPGYRRQGIYTKLHHWLDVFGVSESKEDVYSYIHILNKPMMDYIGEKIGYTPLMQLVRRPLNK
jgi:GNAT superfamily N-acetyltransferase